MHAASGRRSAYLAALVLFAVVATVCAQEKTLVVKSWNLCEYKTDLDGQWQGSLVASDGNCYFASSTHSGRTGGMFFKFDPRTEQITVLCEDISAVCGEDPTALPPQGKIHSAVVEMNGWLYFGTHESYGSATRKYAGAHLIGYELKTGTFKDFGIIEPGYTNYAGVAADPGSSCVYIYLVTPGQSNTAPGLLYRVDMPAGEKHKVAELAPGGYDASVMFMHVDDAGNCWLPEEDATLVKYDPAADRLERFPGALPALDPPRRGKRRRGEYWTYVGPLPGTGKAVVATHEKVYIFDPKADGERFRFVADIGPVHVQSSCGWAQRGSAVFYIQDFGEGTRAASRRLHLMSIDVLAEQPKVVDWGRITDQDGRNPERLPALAADADGRIHMTGDWTALPGDKKTTRQNYDRATQTRSWPEVGRSERFATVRLP